MQQTNEQQKEINYKMPAFPPQVAQDNFGRIFAAIPGMSKLEYFAVCLLPTFIKMQKEKPLVLNGEPITAMDASIYWAKTLIDKINTIDESNETTPIISLENK